METCRGTSNKEVKMLQVPSGLRSLQGWPSVYELCIVGRHAIRKVVVAEILRTAAPPFFALATLLMLLVNPEDMDPY